MSSETDRATAYDLIDDSGHEVHGRCGHPDGIYPCPNSSFNRWKSGFLDFAGLKAEGWSDVQIAECIAACSGIQNFQEDDS